MSMQSFENKKALKLIITLGTGNFGSSDNNTIVFQGFRTSVSIENAGFNQTSTLTASIYGVSQNNINSIYTVQWQDADYIPNRIQVIAIDGIKETIVFEGNIVNAWGVYESMPNVFLYIKAITSYAEQIKQINPRSHLGPVDVVSVMKEIAREIKYNVENNGVDVKLSSIYLFGSGLDQARDLAKQADIQLDVEDKLLILRPNSITPRDSKVPIISKISGMIGVPVYDGYGVTVKTFFNPDIVFRGSIIVNSIVPKANKRWLVSLLSHSLESETPNGAWSSTIRGTYDGLAIR